MHIFVNKTLHKFWETKPKVPEIASSNIKI